MAVHPTLKAGHGEEGLVRANYVEGQVDRTKSVCSISLSLLQPAMNLFIVFARDNALSR